MYFLRNRSSYSFETWTIVISTPENLRVCWVWPSKYNGKWCFHPKCVFSEMDHHTALKLGPLLSALLKTSGCTEFAQLCFSPKLEMDPYSFETCTTNWHTWKWCSSPKCVFSEMDHHTALKLVPVIGTCENLRVHWIGPLNTMESDVLAQNVFSQKQIIIQLWNLYHCNWHTWKPQGVLSLAL